MIEHADGLVVAAAARVNWGTGVSQPRSLEDGLGMRRLESDARSGGLVEVLDVAPALAQYAEFESAVRARAARHAETPLEGFATIRRIDREGPALRIVADHVDGLRLPDLLREAAAGHVPLPLPAALELSSQIVRAVAMLHQLPGGLFHGAITPSHVIVTRRGNVVLTDGVFGTALESLQRNREQLWREFRLAMPVSASLPRFDQRSDVAQLGATVLAVTLGRTLRADEYPRAIGDVVIAATLAARPGETGSAASALRMWLQQSLFLHPRALFGTAIDAAVAFEEGVGAPATRRVAAAALQTFIRSIFGDTPAAEEAAKVAAAWSSPSVVHPAPKGVPPAPPAGDRGTPPPASDEAARSRSSILRAVFPNFRAN
jgi:hypothetical protein